MNYSNGDFYEGQFFNGLRHGNGTMKYYNGAQYRGGFRNDNREGKGEYI